MGRVWAGLSLQPPHPTPSPHSHPPTPPFDFVLPCAHSQGREESERGRPVNAPNRLTLIHNKEGLLKFKEEGRRVEGGGRGKGKQIKKIKQQTTITRENGIETGGCSSCRRALLLRHDTRLGLQTQHRRLISKPKEGETKERTKEQR